MPHIVLGHNQQNEMISVDLFPQYGNRNRANDGTDHDMDDIHALVLTSCQIPFLWLQDTVMNTVADLHLTTRRKE